MPNYLATVKKRWGGNRIIKVSAKNEAEAKPKVEKKLAKGETILNLTQSTGTAETE